MRDELLAMAAADAALRAELARTGALFGGYHPEMAALHRRHASRLRELLAAHGWPRPDRDGADAVEAAWLVVQHAIGEPEFQRRMLAVLELEAEAGRLPRARVALLEDRIRAFEGRPQRYGSQLDWNEAGRLAPWPQVEDPERAEALRAEVGLEPLAEQIDRLERAARDEGEAPPNDLGAYRQAAEDWARSVGWRSPSRSA